jgi:hypothetical protein
VTGWDLAIGSALIYVLLWLAIGDCMHSRSADEADGIKPGWTREDRARARRLFGL